MNKNDEYIPLGFIPYKLDPLLSVISYSVRNKRKIHAEFNKLKRFYIDNPGEFYAFIEEKRIYLKSQSHLTPFDLKSLEEIEKIYCENKSIEELFKFKSELLLDDLTKIYNQMLPFLLKNETFSANQIVDVYFYTTDDEPIFPEEEKKDIITAPSGSKLKVELLRIEIFYFLENYKMFYN